MKEAIKSTLSAALLSLTVIPFSANATSWISHDTQDNGSTTQSTHDSSGSYNGDFGTRQSSDTGIISITSGGSSSGPSGSLTLSRNIHILNNVSIGAGGLTYSFNPWQPGECGSLKYSYSIPATPVSVYASGTCTGNGGIKVSGGASISHSQDFMKWWYFGISITPSISATLGVDLSAEAGPDGQWAKINHPFIVAGIRAPDYLKFTVAPYVSGGFGIAASPFDWIICTVQIKGNITIAKVSPSASFEVGYKRVKKDASRYRYYTDANLDLAVSGGNGSITLDKLILGIKILTLTLISWDPIYKVDFHFWDHFYKSPPLDA